MKSFSESFEKIMLAIFIEYKKHFRPGAQMNLTVFDIDFDEHRNVSFNQESPWAIYFWAMDYWGADLHYINRL